MKNTTVLQERRILEALAREEVEFWESYIVRCLENESSSVPPRAIQALAMAEEKLNLCILAISGQNGEDRVH